jgi:hypothetical protein
MGTYCGLASSDEVGQLRFGVGPQLFFSRASQFHSFLQQILFFALFLRSRTVGLGPSLLLGRSGAVFECDNGAQPLTKLNVFLSLDENQNENVNFEMATVRVRQWLTGLKARTKSPKLPHTLS